MSIINKYKDVTRAIFIYNNDGKEPIVDNRTGLRDENGNPTSKRRIKIHYNSEELHSIATDDIPKLYYTSIPDIELENFSSALNVNPQRNQTLDDYHFEKIEKNVMFLSSDLSVTLKKKNSEIPIYDKLFISAKPLSKRDLRNTYGGFATEGEIETIQKQNLEDLWNEYKVKDDSKNHLTNDSLDFFKNIEVNILSYIIIDATSMKTEYNGKPDVLFEDFLKKNDFEEKLMGFLSHKIAFIDKYLYLRIKNDIKVLNFKTALDLLDNLDFNKELDEKEKRVLDRLKHIRLKVSSSGNVSILFNSLENLIKEELFEKDFERFRDGVQKVLNRIDTSISGAKGAIEKQIQSSINEIQRGIKLNFQNHRDNRAEIKDQLTGKIKQSIKLFSSIFNFNDVLKVVKTKKGFQVDDGILTLNLTDSDFKDFKDLLQAYRKMISCFNENSVINAQVLQFTPSVRLSFGEKSLLNLFSAFYGFTLNKYNHQRLKRNYILLLDEADLGFHPLWKRRYVSYLLNVLPDIFNQLFVKLDTHATMDEAEIENISPKIQIILTTHDPLALSDIPNHNVTYIKKGEDFKPKILRNIADDERPDKSFGANISDLIAHSFFIEGGLVGDFASNKINETIAWLSFKTRKKYNGKYKIIDDPVYHKRVIELIDEPIVRHKLRHMYIEATNDKEEIEKEIERLKRKINRND